MSEQQKLFASVSGAVVVHVLLLVVVFFLLSTRSIGSSLQGDSSSKPDEPQEVTILMSELMELVEVEPPTPELQPEPELPRPYMSTDLNAAELDVPENARFESDRNTSAASEMAPDLSAPQQDGPTLKGDDRFPFFELETRKYTDGEVSQPASMAAAPSMPVEATQPGALPLPPEAGHRAENPSEALPNPEAKDGEDTMNAEGGDSEPVAPIADRRTRPDGSIPDELATEEVMERSFVDPNGLQNATILKKFEGDKDQFAASSDEEGDIGELADIAQKQTMASGKVGKEGESELKEQTETQTEQAMKASADAGIFAEGYTRERLQSSMNGTLSNIGQNAVDAEETAIGKYKKAVHDAIGRKWYRYHTQHKESVTWGVLKLKFRVDESGTIHGLRVVKNESNTLMTEFSLQAVIDANIPPMPEEVAEELGIGGLDLDYDFIIY